MPMPIPPAPVVGGGRHNKLVGNTPLIFTGEHSRAEEFYSTEIPPGIPHDLTVLHRANSPFDTSPWTNLIVTQGCLLTLHQGTNNPLASNQC
jgi:hypothetical protein